MGDEEFDMLFLFLKLRKKVAKTCKKSEGFGQRKFLINVSLFVHFLTFVKQARIFLYFFWPANALC